RAVTTHMNTYTLLTIAIAAVITTAPHALLYAQQIGERIFYTDGSEDSQQSFERYARYIDIVAPQCLKVDEDGIVWGGVDQRMTTAAKKYGVKIMPLLMNPGFNQEVLHKLLLSREAQERCVAALVELCKKEGWYGIQYDFENIHIADRAAYTAFFKLAADSLKKHGFSVSIAVVPRARDYAGEGEYQKWMYEYWRGGYDYKTLGAIADFISFMSYDQHTRRTTPGPVAGYTWMERCLKYILQYVPPEKISLGLALYSDYWFPSYTNPQTVHAWGRSLKYPDALGVMESAGGKKEWNERDKVHYSVFERDDVYEHIYFEDARSFQARLELVRKYNLRGISCWRLGQEDPAIFTTVLSARK
ncbi:MAG: glycosyl hydrolase family 18 protein, partial [Bacteroidota bacterium]|nr:glycosyl hydrolase family 18 protein [Candidatus Kapabacteria bacterium]MDW8221275.1 glycosyl hydrolase family 18 protein [Bacteroidota bacterium]